MTVIIATGFLLILILLIFTLSERIAYGGFVIEKDYEFLMYLDESKIGFNLFNDGILNCSPYIAKLPVPVLCKYYVEDGGRVPRWSKLSRKIDYYFDAAKKNTQADQ